MTQISLSSQAYVKALKLIFNRIPGITLQQKATNHCVTALVII